MKVLVACEFSGTVRDAFRKRGHEAWSCDIIRGANNNRYHLMNNVLDVLDFGWDLMIAHPPCTYLCNSGVQHLLKNKERRHLMREGCRFFNALQKAPIKRIAIENPIPHKYAKKRIGHYTQIIQPWQFGHGETKAICLWLKHLPELEPTDIVEGREQRIANMGKKLKLIGLTRSQERAVFYKGIAKAMAKQWGCNA